jgi:hypothetical protein
VFLLESGWRNPRQHEKGFKRASTREATLVRVILQKGFLRREFENVSLAGAEWVT